MHLIDCCIFPPVSSSAWAYVSSFFCFLESAQGAFLKEAGDDTQLEFADTSLCRCFVQFMDTTLTWVIPSVYNHSTTPQTQGKYLCHCWFSPMWFFFFIFCIRIWLLIINVHVNIFDSCNIFQASTLTQMLKSWPLISRWWLSDYVLIRILNVILFIFGLIQVRRYLANKSQCYKF